MVLVKGTTASRMDLVVGGLVSPTISRQVVGIGAEDRVRADFLPHLKPAWAEIDLTATANNVERVKAIVGPAAEVMAVVKANAYGHGAVPVARTALRHGATWLGVACLGEGVELREAGITSPTLILGFTPSWDAAEVVRHGLAATVYSADVAQELSRAALAQGRPPAAVHVKVDTGMGRLGLQPVEVLSFVEDIQRLPGLDVQGIYTHFATADSADQSHARASARGIPGSAGGANSARGRISIRSRRQQRGDPDHPRGPLRPRPPGSGDARAAPLRGSALPGPFPARSGPEGPDCPGQGPSARRLCKLWLPLRHRAPVEDRGDSRRLWRRLPAPPRTATARCWSGDGGPRLLGRSAWTCSMVDVTDVPGARPGDEVVLIGRQDAEEIAAEEVAERLGTINYEMTTALLARLPREVRAGSGPPRTG